jgi:hypothetical protein
VSEHPSPLPDPAALAAKLPVPQPDEPESLRQDILDELNDHLQSAYDHELIKTGDNQTAAARVLDRFGDPTAIARQLWWDAMKGPAMRQTLLIVATAVSMTISLVALGGLAWSMTANRIANDRLMELQREFAEASRSQQAERDALRKELLTRLDDREEASANFLPLKVRVVRETSRQPVMSPLELSTAPELPAPMRKPAEDGTGLIYDFGLVAPGKYQIIFRPSDTQPWSGTQSAWVRPGNPEVLDLSYPDVGADAPGRVRFDLGVPEDLKEAGLEQLRFAFLMGGIKHYAERSVWVQRLRLPGTRLLPASEPNTTPFMMLVTDGRGQILEAVGGTFSLIPSAGSERRRTWTLSARRPAMDGMIELVGGEYELLEMHWFRSTDQNDPHGFSSIHLDEMFGDHVKLRMSVGKESVFKPIDAQREEFWNWVRWSGLLPATETVTLPLSAITLDKTSKRAWAKMLPERAQSDNGVPSLGEVTNPPDGLLSPDNSAVRIWITSTMEMEGILPSRIEDRTSLNLGVGIVDAIDREKGTITIRVMRYLKPLIEAIHAATPIRQSSISFSQARKSDGGEDNVLSAAEADRAAAAFEYLRKAQLQ